MQASRPTQRVMTSHGSIFVERSSGNGPPLLLIHGNSSRRGMFARQFQSRLADRYRLIAIDLPGHGLSDDAADPARTYSLPALPIASSSCSGFSGSAKRPSWAGRSAATSPSRCWRALTGSGA